jgi:protein arginine kinase activator
MSERPLECSDCQKPTCVNFIRLNLQQSSELSLCKDCPMLARLTGEPSRLHAHLLAQAREIACGNCSTTMEMIQMGSVLGCTQCYEVFSDIICNQHFKIPNSAAVHCGRSVGEERETSSNLHLYALNEALQETLSREEYEEAAHIRDQIKAILELKSEDQLAIRDER